MQRFSSPLPERILLCATLILLGGLPHISEVRGQKQKPEEVIAKHLEAIASAETLASVKSRVSTGTVIVTFREPGTGQLGGRAVLASEGAKNMLAMVFDNATNYPHEKIGFDGKDVSGSYVRPGVRSTLGDFLLTHKAVVKHGLIGGVLSQSWPFFDATRKLKVESGGMKKIGDRQTHQLKFYPSGGSDIRVTMFFDAETFQHLRTEYTRTVVAQMGSAPETSARQSETRYKMIEDFSDYRKEGGLILPHGYKILLEIAGRTGTFRAEWEVALSDFKFNQRIDPTSFDVDDKPKE